MTNRGSVSPVVEGFSLSLSSEEKLFLGQREVPRLVDPEGEQRLLATRYGTRGHSVADLIRRRRREERARERRFFVGCAKVERDRRNFSWPCQAESPRRDATYTNAQLSSGPTDRPPSMATSTPCSTCCKRPSESWPCAATDLTRVTSRHYGGKYWSGVNRPRQLREIAGTLSLSSRTKSCPYYMDEIIWDPEVSYVIINL